MARGSYLVWPTTSASAPLRSHNNGFCSMLSLFQYQCLCKPNVVGRTCDRCMHGFYNFSGSNPVGCTSCGCSPRGTVSGTRHCHVQNGRCDCKNHVIGKTCENCRDGYYGMRSHDIFGCKACKCDPGGSVSRNCFKHLGDCQCVSGVKGKKCNSLYSSRAKYFPTLYHIFVELEAAVLTSNTRIRVPIGADDHVFPFFSGTGYAMFPAYKDYAVALYIPKTRKYRVIFHYALRDHSRTSAKVVVHPRGSKITSHNFEVQFSPPNPSEQQTKNLRTTVNRRGVNREFQLEKGTWTVVITSHNSMLLLPTIGFDITVPESGPYVLMATYLHPERFIQRVFVKVDYQRGMLEILPCKYQFACRQFAMDENKRPKAFELKATPEINESSITVIPQAKWNAQYVQPQLLCRIFNESCISSTYQIPADAIQLVAFSRRSKDKMTSLFNGVVDASVSYYVIVHYQQSHSLSKKVEQISIMDHVKPNISVTFQYCPANSGCRVVLGEEESLSIKFSKGSFTATIQHERRTHLNYSPTTESLNSYKTVARIISMSIQLADGSTEKTCFSLTIRFNAGPLNCRCNVLGSRSTFCDEFGGQCLCRSTYVVGRRCDRCKLGHSGFPRCRRCGCHEVGSVSLSCTSNGRCRCKPGFGGYKCDRCVSSSYYGFPECKTCACNNLGSLSTFCRSRDGQCQCRRNFQGQKCNECRIGFYDFPSCKACDCNPAGIKLLPGEKAVDLSTILAAGAKITWWVTIVTSCKAFHYNLQINNPVGCQSCDCNINGNSGIDQNMRTRRLDNAYARVT
ncbi:Laminin subunit [Desmophyllum pertusum]|uniref:Laminin subunit n=1 Tax=Desmophyllum pertusum TaxID=174260 RepID=A0A9X0CEX6_9CNID|nr:Laminin subunit [Desmophyllum pertusum]